MCFGDFVWASKGQQSAKPEPVTGIKYTYLSFHIFGVSERDVNSQMRSNGDAENISGWRYSDF